MNHSEKNNNPFTRRAPLLVLLAGAALLLAACGGGSGTAVIEDPPIDEPPSGEMVQDHEYTVGPGDRLVSTSTEPARIEVRHDMVTDTRHVTLLAGSADLLRGDYHTP